MLLSTFQDPNAVNTTAAYAQSRLGIPGSRINMANPAGTNAYDPNKWNATFAGSPVYGAGYSAAGSPSMATYGQQPGVSLGQVASGGWGAGKSGTGYETTGPEPTNIPGAAGSGQGWPGTGGAAPYSGGGYGTGATPGANATYATSGVGVGNPGWNPQTGYGPGTSSGASSTSFGVPPAIAQYLDPSMAFQQAQGLRALQSSAAAQGGLLSGNTLKDITNYSQGLASTGYNNAFNQAAQQQGFGAGLSQQDYQNQLNLAALLTGQGQFGTAGTASANNLLATLLSQNTLAGGNANAAGTIGGSNAVTGGVSQAIANLLSQNLYNRIPGLNGP